MIEHVSRMFAGAGDPAAALRIGACCALPRLGDLGVLALYRDGEVTRVEVAALGSEREPEISELITHAMPAITRLAVRDWDRGRHFRWLSRIDKTSTRFLASEPELLALLGTLGVSCLMVVPLRAGGGKLIGGMAFARTHAGEPAEYHARDLATAQAVARRVALGIENAELRTRSADGERRRARLENALLKWIKVFDVAQWGAAIIDADDLRIEAANPAFARLHGYTVPDHLLGRLYGDLLPPERGEEMAGWSHQSEASASYESVHLRLDGRTFPVLTNVTLLETAPREKSYVVTVQDVTELKRAEERLRRAQRMEAVGRLAGGVAHEVNNMMTIILGFSDLLTAAAELPQGRQRDIEEIRKAATRTARVTQQLLAFSRQQILQPADLQLNEVVSEMSSVLQQLLPANVRVETALSPLPTAVHADRSQIDQVLINLAFNARDAMPLGGTLRLGTDSRHFEPEDGRPLIGIPVPRGQYAVLSLSDTGHGMTAEVLGQMFEPFFTTKPIGTGTGLGLATVYGIVKQSGGFIWVDSEPGIGTTFTICLPQVRPQSGATTGTVSDEREHHAHPSATVLLIEDEEGVRELARRVLEQEGYAVLDVKTGADAIATLDHGSPEIDLVLSDVVTPDLAAVELEAGLRSRRPEVPLLYMSGYSWEEVVKRGLVAAERHFIQKPFTPAELADAVARELAAAGPVVER